MLPNHARGRLVGGASWILPPSLLFCFCVLLSLYAFTIFGWNWAMELPTDSYWLTGTTPTRWPKVPQIAHSMFYSQICDCLLHWVVLSPGSPSAFATWSTKPEHGLNLAYALFEIFVPRAASLRWRYTALSLRILLVSLSPRSLFLIARYLIVLREWIAVKKLGKAGKFSSRGPKPTVHEEVEKGNPLPDELHATILPGYYVCINFFTMETHL
ncbi:hypothetical protein BDU57DRAFT_585685 [Ampelomyces quisqualis]|uniref:Uncharacterized protein n=1 Tax=Ampelomyces quisqualis TaxID=50730 RepID=A0A6A5QUT3_AMPQU|nr:hypothetical protein BDU57DRAFT_585685 [Ampelomyces quisqualis]